MALEITDSNYKEVLAEGNLIAIFRRRCTVTRSGILSAGCRRSGSCRKLLPVDIHDQQCHQQDHRHGGQNRHFPQLRVHLLPLPDIFRSPS